MCVREGGRVGLRVRGKERETILISTRIHIERASKREKEGDCVCERERERH